MIIMVMHIIIRDFRTEIYFVLLFWKQRMSETEDIFKEHHVIFISFEVGSPITLSLV